ncbi:hypothetical protein RYX36_000384 [Vicia faba]
MRMKSSNPLVLGNVIGDVLDPFANSVSLKVVYENNKEVINSGELKPYQIVNPPRVQVGGNDLRTLYTLVMVNPDAPSPCHPHMREYLICPLPLLFRKPPPSTVAKSFSSDEFPVDETFLQTFGPNSKESEDEARKRN